MRNTSLSLTKTVSADSLRTRELGAIHAAKRSLALQEDSYRAIISRFSKRRTESSKDLTQAERRDVIEYFRSIGFKQQKRKPSPKIGRMSHADAARSPQAMKLKALWAVLYDLGVVRDPGGDALAAFVCRHTGIEVIQWNRPHELGKAIDCLVGWCARVGYLAQRYEDGPPCPMRGSFKPSLIHCQWMRLGELGSPAPSLLIWLQGIGIHVGRVSYLTHDQADIAIAKLGEFIRQHPDNEADGSA